MRTSSDGLAHVELLREEIERIRRLRRRERHPQRSETLAEREKMLVSLIRKGSDSASAGLFEYITELVSEGPWWYKIRNSLKRSSNPSYEFSKCRQNGQMKWDFRSCQINQKTDTKTQIDIEAREEFVRTVEVVIYSETPESDSDKTRNLRQRLNFLIDIFHRVNSNGRDELR